MILLFSGGVDSYIAWHYLNKPKTIYFDLNSAYSQREQKVIKELIPQTEIDACLDLSTREQDDFYIPFRNLYLAMLACRFSDNIVIVGIKGDDVSDKTPEIFQKFSSILSEMEEKTITIWSPFWHYTKDQIVEWYLYNVGSTYNLLQTISCYNSHEDTNYCGRCTSCFRKWVAFRNNGINITFHSQQILDIYLLKAKEGYYVTERNDSIITAVEAYLC
jgi:7-cyano-7-deazaguanine synthase in queuosine biosynthesis